MRIALIFFITALSPTAWGKGSIPRGVAFDVAFGTGAAAIENPDSSKARYKMLNVDALVDMPVMEGSSFSASLLAGIRYLDLENSANSATQSEVANMIGPGMGLRLRALRFFAEINYHMMLARHYTVGNLSTTTKYQMPLMSWQVGYSIPLKSFMISVSYSQGTGTVPKSETQLTRDSPYTDQIYWLRLTYSTGQSFSKFFSFLF